MTKLDMAGDLLSLVRSHPADSFFWRNLSTVVRTLVGTEREQVRQAIESLPVDGARAQWLKYSALFDVTRDWDWATRQAALIDRVQTDAVMEFALLAHMRALTMADSHAEFGSMLARAGVGRAMTMLAGRFADVSGPGDATDRAGRRVAIYTPQAVSGRHAPTAMALSMVELVCALGHECRLFAGQEMSIPFINGLSGSNDILVDPGLDMASLKIRSTMPVRVTIADSTRILERRLPDLCLAIDAYRPDLILFVGFFSPVIAKLQGKYPIVGLSTHAVAPLVPVDIWLSADDPAGDDAALSFPYRFQSKGPVAADARLRAGLPDGAILIATTGHRLDREMSPAWVAQMLALLDREPDVHWVLVGLLPGQKLTAIPDHPRIHLHPQVAHLERWLAAADIYANPPRLGGGASVAMAMEQGLAVAALAGNDGGDKLGPFAAADEGHYFAALSDWVRTPSARVAMGAEMKRRFAGRLDISGEAARNGLATALTLAADRAARRLKG